MGDERGALPLFMEELEGCAARFGDEHEETLRSVDNVLNLLFQLDQVAEAENLISKYGLEEAEEAVEGD